jgi:phosphatidate cytidylyltransferase
MALHWPTFFTRLASAIVFSAVMLFVLILHDWTLFVALSSVIMILCLRDYLRLAGKIHQRPQPYPYPKLIYLASTLLLWAIAVIPVIVKSDTGGDPDLVERITLLSILAPLAGGTGLILLLLIFMNAQINKKPDLLRIYGQALLYILVPSACFILLVSLHWSYPLVLILCIWMNDTMAYLVGSFIGKTPFSKISPKKTWEGTAGGAILAIAGAALAAHFIADQNMVVYIALALCAAVAGTIGDLYESKLKRAAGVKDSGTMMPGHGGALDRFDSLLFAAPCALAMVLILQAVGLA